MRNGTVGNGTEKVKAVGNSRVGIYDLVQSGSAQWPVICVMTGFWAVSSTGSKVRLVIHYGPTLDNRLHYLSRAMGMSLLLSVQ